MIIDEIKYAEKILEEKIIDSNHKKYELAIVAKFLAYQGKSYKEIEKFLENFCKENVKYFNEVTDRWMIDGAIRAAKTFYIKVPEEVIITHQEISSIQKTEIIDHQQFLFTLLILAKIQKYVPSKKRFKKSAKLVGLWYNGEIKEIFRHAHLQWSKPAQYKFFHNLYLEGYLNYNPPYGSIPVMFAAEGYPAIVIKDFRELGLQYLKYIGNNKIVECEKCEKVFKRRSRLQVLCSDCYKEHRLELSREIMRKNYKTLAGSKDDLKD